MAVGQFFLSWVGDDSDSRVFSFELTHNEGEFASLDVTIQNPRVGLLSSGRPVDALFSYEGSGGTIDLLVGRVVGIPQEMDKEIVKVTFLARPDDYDDQKRAFAETLKVAPFWDPIFVDPSRKDDPDFVLEARPSHWYIDRVTGEVGISDIIEGEDGVVDFADTMFEDSLSITYNQPPATTVNCKCELSWKQTGTGGIDLSDAIELAFADGGYYNRGYLATYTGGGLMAAWPKPNANIGGGWKVGVSSCEVDEIASNGIFAFRSQGSGGGGFRSNSQTIQLVSNPDDLQLFDADFDGDGDPSTDGGFLNGAIADDHSIDEKTIPSVVAGCTSPNYYGSSQSIGGSEGYLGASASIGMQLWQLKGTLTADYTANRSRKETVTFSIAAGVQPVVTSSENDVIEVNLSTSQIDQPVDPGGVIPIGDLRRNSYMLTDRGKQTLEYLIVYCRARLLARARAVTVKFQVPFESAVDLTLKNSAQIADPRLPGGVVAGKVTSLSYKLDASDGKLVAEVTMMSTAGTGGELPTLSTEVDAYASGYSAGYTVTTGGGSQIATADIQYENFNNTAITDDGLDFLNMQAADAILSLVVINPAKRQEFLMDSVVFASSSSAIQTLNENCTKIALALRPVANTDTFETAFPIVVSDLVIPKTIDLEAAS